MLPIPKTIRLLSTISWVQNITKIIEQIKMNYCQQCICLDLYTMVVLHSIPWFVWSRDSYICKETAMGSVRELWSFLLIFTIYLFVSVLATTMGWILFCVWLEITAARNATFQFLTIKDIHLLNQTNSQGRYFCNLSVCSAVNIALP